MKMTILSLGCLLLVACGGKGAVDLGENSGNSGWADTTVSGAAAPAAAATSATPKPAAVPQTLYDGDLVRAIAVDETTIAAAIQSPSGGHIDMCQLANCQGTLQTIHRETSEECKNSGYGFPSSLDDLLISHGEVIWSACSGDGRSHFMACATSGCPEGARQISPTVFIQSAGTVAATADWLYWWDKNPALAIARCPREGCEVAEFQKISDANDRLFFEGGPYQLALDESEGMLYASGGAGISRMPMDFSTGLTPFYEDPVGVTGLAVVGEHVYFALSTLTGQIRRCPITGCEQGPELVTSAPRWPVNPIADAKAVYWRHQAQTNVIDSAGGIEGAISAFPLDGGAANGVAAVRLGYVAGWSFSSLNLSMASGPIMNSHHIYWSEPRGSGTDPFKNAIRMGVR